MFLSTNTVEEFRSNSLEEVLRCVYPLVSLRPVGFFFLLQILEDLFEEEPSVVVQLPFGTVAQISELVLAKPPSAGEAPKE